MIKSLKLRAIYLLEWVALPLAKGANRRIRQAPVPPVASESNDLLPSLTMPACVTAQLGATAEPNIRGAGGMRRCSSGENTREPLPGYSCSAHHEPKPAAPNGKNESTPDRAPMRPMRRPSLSDVDLN